MEDHKEEKCTPLHIFVHFPIWILMEIPSAYGGKNKIGMENFKSLKVLILLSKSNI